MPIETEEQRRRRLHQEWTAAGDVVAPPSARVAAGGGGQAAGGLFGPGPGVGGFPGLGVGELPGPDDLLLPPEQETGGGLGPPTEYDLNLPPEEEVAAETGGPPTNVGYPAGAYDWIKYLYEQGAIPSSIWEQLQDLPNAADLYDPLMSGIQDAINNALSSGTFQPGGNDFLDFGQDLLTGGVDLVDMVQAPDLTGATPEGGYDYDPTTSFAYGGGPGTTTEASQYEGRAGGTLDQAIKAALGLAETDVDTSGLLNALREAETASFGRAISAGRTAGGGRGFTDVGGGVVGGEMGLRLGRAAKESAATTQQAILQALNQQTAARTSGMEGLRGIASSQYGLETERGYGERALAQGDVQNAISSFKSLTDRGQGEEGLRQSAQQLGFDYDALSADNKNKFNEVMADIYETGGKLTEEHNKTLANIYQSSLGAAGEFADITQAGEIEAGQQNIDLMNTLNQILSGAAGATQGATDTALQAMMADPQIFMDLMDMLLNWNVGRNP